ncbi:hypothetical protein ACFWOJ_24120 [Streptomyces sp. NPDC058439]|uniref:Mu transposase domain-containing protein n=1 Tax=Streptomyces sp. NPDC058439 TaxID=3346500 RepID=UPI00365FF9F1
MPPRDRRSRLPPARLIYRHPQGRTLYSVPWKLIGKRVDVRSTATFVQVFLGGALVKTHGALEQCKRTHSSDYPPEKIAFHTWGPRRGAAPSPRRSARPARPIHEVEAQGLAPHVGRWQPDCQTGDILRLLSDS